MAMDAATLVIDGVDIYACTDDFKLNELLDNCNEYESRRQIRARIKSLLSGNGNASNAKNGPNAVSNQSGRTFGSSVSTKSEVVTRRTSVQTTRNQSAFSKFQQLDQSVKSTPSSPATSPQVKEGQVFRLGVVRSASGVKDVLLKWCQARTREYQNVKIENFSTSWNNGLAFCALIHHYYPDAFDYQQLDARNRAYNFDLAFRTAEEKAGIAPLLDVEDMVMMARPDWKCVFTYVQSFYRRFKDE